MANLGTLEVLLTATTEKFVEGLEGAEHHLHGFQEEVAKVGIASGVAFGALAAAVGIGLEALQEQRNAEIRLTSVINARNSAMDPAVIEEYAAALQETTTFSHSATTAAAAMLARYVDTDDEMKQLLPRVQDLAAFMGTDLESAANQVARAVGSGVATSLTRAGVVFTETEAKAFKFADAEQRVAMISQKLEHSVGGVAAAMADTAGGAFAQMKNEAEDVAEKFGMIVESPIIAMLHEATDVIRRFNVFMGGLSEHQLKAITSATVLAGGLLSLTTVVSGLIVLWPKLSLAVKAFGTSVQTVLLPLLALVGVIGAAMTLKDVLVTRGFVGASHEEMVAADKRLSSAGLTGQESFGEGMMNFFVESFTRPFAFLTDSIGGLGQETKKSAGELGDSSHGPSVDVDKLAEQADLASKEFKTFADQIGEDSTKSFDKFFKLIEDSSGALVSVPTQAGRDQFNSQVDPIVHKMNTEIDAREKLNESIDMSAGDYASAGKQIGQAAIDVASRMGKAGEILNGAMQGFAQGGPVGAIIGVIMAVLSNLKSFMAIIDIIDEDLGVLFDAIDGLLAPLLQLTQTASKHLQPVFAALGEVIDVLTQPLTVFGSLIEIANPLFEALTWILKGLAIVFNFLGAGVRWLYNAFIDVATEFFRFIGNFTNTDKQIRQLQSKRFIIDLDQETKDIISGKGVSYKTQGQAANDLASLLLQQRVNMAVSTSQGAHGLGDAMQETADAAHETAITLREVNEALTNVPSGFKIALARFGATEGEGAGGAGLPGMGNTYINVRAYDAHHLTKQLEDAARFDNMARRGTQYGGTTYGVPRNGA